MLYLAIDQHKNQMTINIRNEQGDVIQKGQVSTKHAEVDDFFVAFAKKARKHRGYMAIVEVCGFNDWLLEKLKKTRCSEIVVIQPDNSVVNKTDKRDANALGELLWNNRKRLPVVDRFEIDRHIQSWELHDKQILEVEAELVKRSETKAADVLRLKAIPGISAMGAITLLSRIGDIHRFKNPDSLANYLGLTPGCHNSAG